MSFAVTLASTFGCAFVLSAVYAAKISACLALRDRLRDNQTERAACLPAARVAVAGTEPELCAAQERLFAPHILRHHCRRPLCAGPARRLRDKRDMFRRQRDNSLSLSPIGLRAALLSSVDHWA